MELIKNLMINAIGTNIIHKVFYKIQVQCKIINEAI